MIKAEEIIVELQKFDNPKGYKLTYEKVSKNLQPVINKVTVLGEPVVGQLHPLLEHEENWSCLFALDILAQIKSEKSILPLIEFIRRTDDSDYWESGEGAMKALTAIGKPAIDILIGELKKDFQQQEHYTYLVGALAGIKDEQVLQFMVDILQDYINDYKKYDEWFDLIPFVLDFDHQDSIEALPLLEKLSNMKHLSSQEKLEVDESIKKLKDPEKYEKENAEQIELMKKELPETMRDVEKILDPKKLKIDHEEFLKRASEADENFEASFKCKKCGERQNLKTGLIWDIDDDVFAFEHEIMCKHCHGHDIRLSDDGLRELQGKKMRILLGKEGGIVPVNEKIKIENKKMPFKESYNYILKRISEEPENAELLLRAANSACKNNKYEQAVEFFNKSMEIDDSLIANYINLIEIYLYRAEYYGLNEYKSKAEEVFDQMIEVLNSFNYNTVTIHNEEDLHQLVHEFGHRLGFEMQRKKIGRNEPCPCGSGIKYKKCCLDGG